MKRLTALLLTLLLLLSVLPAQAAKSKSTPTPAPLEIQTEVIQEVPEQIQQVLDQAYEELIAGDGLELKKRNKYTDWNGSHTGYGWCGGFITWCMLQHDVPMQKKNDIKAGEVPGVVHVKEAGVGKLVTGYQKMYRTTMIPQKGFIAVYGNQMSKYGISGLYHVGLVYDVEKLSDTRYRITTIEGNVSSPGYEDGHKKAPHTIRMFVRDYDMSAEKKNNITLVPEEERTRQESSIFSYQYTYNNKTLYINMFLMPWNPNE